MEQARPDWGAGQAVALAFVRPAQVPHRQDFHAGSFMVLGVVAYPGVVDVDVPLAAAGAGGVE